jgi:two-component system phosphate regulon sensor histidine kinase PhoR
MMMKLKLHWKLTAIFCSAIIGGLLLGYVYLTAHLKTFLDQDLQNNLKREIYLVRDLVERQGDSGQFQPLVRKISKEIGVRVTVVAVNGHVYADSDLTDEELKVIDNHGGRVEIKDALRTGFGLSKRYSYTLEKDLLYLAVPFGEKGVEGVVRLAMPLSAVALFEAGSQKIVFLALLLAFLFSLGFTYFIAMLISRPLEEMAAVARAMAKGDFSRKPSVRSRDEVGDLARAITHMSDQIREKIDDVEQEKAKLDAVIMHMSEGIMVVDEKGVVRLMNPSLRKMFLIDIPVHARRAVEIIRNSQLSDMLTGLLTAKERMISQELLVTFPEERMLKVNGVVIRTSYKIEGAVLVFHDITELRRLEKVRQDFVANVSHELRTPVASIKGYAETLLAGAMEDRAALKEFLGIIHENSDRLVNLINDLLDLSRIESGRMKISPAPVDALPVVQRCFNILEKAVQDKNLSLSVDFPSDLPNILADEVRFSQVVLNLLDNAVKYTPEGGSVIIKAGLRDRMVCFDIIDTGIGIPEQDLPRIFERFYRVDKARSRDQGGTGLGLSIVKHIILAHGGEVWASSRLGRGTTFSFTLPQA